LLGGGPKGWSQTIEESKKVYATKTRPSQGNSSRKKEVPRMGKPFQAASEDERAKGMVQSLKGKMEMPQRGN